MKIYDTTTENMINPIGTDCENPRFGWKIKSGKNGIFQHSYNIIVSDDEDFKNIIWESGDIISGFTNAVYAGPSLSPSKRFYWRVSIRDNTGTVTVGDTSYFETGLMGKDRSVWSGAKPIGSPQKTINTDSLTEFSFSADFRVISGSAGFVICGRDKDNYISVDTDIENGVVKVFDFADNAWDDAVPSVNTLGNACGFPVKEYLRDGWNHAEITVIKDKMILKINSRTVISDNLIPPNPPNKPRRQCMLSVGLKAEHAEFKNIEIKNAASGEIYQSSILKDPRYSVLGALGSTDGGIITVRNELRLINPVPAVNLRKIFNVREGVKSARLYCSAMGFYDVYINGAKINSSFYNPGFTDYRKRIYYQVYDITDRINAGKNVISAVVGKGYYTGYLGYNEFPMIYGKQNTFLAKQVITYNDGSTDITVSDKHWRFTDKGPVMNADYLQGEDYDARLEYDPFDESDLRWGPCGEYDFPEYAAPTNGVLENIPFELEADKYPKAEIFKILPSVMISENPKGHFIFDFGRNMVGTVRLCAHAANGTSIKLRYGEMLCDPGRLYTANLRNAANTDTYTFKGGAPETFIPSLTSHGFRYAEISGNGFTLSRDDFDKMNITCDGLVITDTPEVTGYFECSNDDINKLGSNIEWGQRGNSLLVFTDCPQRNERMGWTGDAQVFAGTAAYNMNVKAFMNKWLADVRDAQLLYNRRGAVPDTAPLGGDNRPMGGCGGWGDAAVIVPWKMYCAYGDETILRDNYDMMKKWVEYQALPERRNNGIRTVDGKEVPEKSDLSSLAFIQVQQSRGDHLAYDESTPFILSATAYAAHSAYLLSRTAGILGFKEDEQKYKERFENIKNAFGQAWVTEDGTIAYWGEMSKSVPDLKGNIINRTYYSEKSENGARPSQTAYALAIDFGLIPDEKLDGAKRGFERSIDDTGKRPSTGFLGISHIMPALTKTGLTETAFELLEQTEYPGWLYSVKNGATTIWERWNSYISESKTFANALMNSFNHYSYGAVGEWMFGCILGINTSSEKNEAGYKKIILKPTFGGTLTYARGKYESASGEIVSEWRRENGKFVYSCTVPSNTYAVIYVPSDKNVKCCGGEPILLGIDNGRTVFKAHGGKYMFTADL
ncbi:MAG: family 78 glycoside hydrolase catalytic domain [Oscillospiraceae bacterium]|nr:family 78 glycoside hydrolase catalytic domain [Oscillospiraceae bacterium]